METFNTRTPAQPFKVDTKGLCFFCLKFATVRSRNSQLPMKLLLRYLKIDVYKLCNFSSHFLEFIGAIDDGQVEVELCHSCDDNIYSFAALYQEMEVMRMQLDSTLQNVYEAVHDSQNHRRLTEYRRRLHSQCVSEMFNANFAENLRAETKQKCFQRMKNNMVPRFNVTKEEMNSAALSLHSKRRKPGPKSKTVPGNSRLKALLEMGPNSHCQPGPSTSNSAREVKREYRQKQASPKPFSKKENITDQQVDTFGEHFLVKLEPSISLTEENSNENNDQEDPLFQNNDNVAAFTGEQQNDLSGFLHFSENNGLNDLYADGKIKKDNSNTLPESYFEDHGNGNFSCKQCGKVFDKLTRLRGHLSIHKSSSTTSSIFPTKKKQLKLKKRGKRYLCKTCRRFFYSFTNYKFHLKSHAGGGESSTTALKKVVNGAGKLGKTKVTSKGDDDNKRYACSHCKSIFNTPRVLSTHKRSKHPLAVLGHHMPPGTTDDELNVAVRQAVSNHIRDDLNKRYCCGYCEGAYPHPSHLRLHILIKHVDVLVSTVLRNKAIQSGADADIQLEDISLDGMVEVQMEQEHEEGSLLFDGDENQEVDENEESQDQIEIDQDQLEFEKYAQEDLEVDGETYEIDSNVNGNTEEVEQESSISISEPFSLSNGN